MDSPSFSLMIPTPFGQGHSTRSDPIISPMSTASRRSWWRSSSQPRAVENRVIPTTAPAVNTARLTRSSPLRSCTAPRKTAYIPIISSRNEPEMPGRIMAQMATAPAPKKARSDGSATGPDWKPSSTKVMTPTPSIRASSTGERVGQHPPCHHHRAGHQAQEQAGHLLGAGLQQALDERGQGGQGHPDAGQQRQQESPLDLGQAGPDPADVEPGRRCHHPGAAADVVEQALVDAEDQGHRAAGHPGDDVRCAHAEAPGEGQEWLHSRQNTTRWPAGYGSRPPRDRRCGPPRPGPATPGSGGWWPPRPG